MNDLPFADLASSAVGRIFTQMSSYLPILFPLLASILGLAVLLKIVKMITK